MGDTSIALTAVPAGGRGGTTSSLTTLAGGISQPGGAALPSSPSTRDEPPSLRVERSSLETVDTPLTAGMGRRGRDGTDSFSVKKSEEEEDATGETEEQNDNTTARRSYRASLPSGEGQSTGEGVLSVEVLQQRLAMSEEWNRRLHQELQELLQLPPVDLQAWRERMESVEISVPLLQRYDAVIQEKEERIEELQLRIQHLHAEVEAYLSREQHLRQDDMLRKGLLEKIKQQAEEDIRREAGKVRGMGKKYAELERELCRVVEQREEEMQRAVKAREECQAAERALERVRKEKQYLQDTVEVMRRGSQQQNATQKEDALEKETLQLQLQVLLREREERKKELEQVRSKMQQGLRQAGENHAAHLRVVEERHRVAMEEQQQVSRTHEMEILKLRAQLARMDPRMTVNSPFYGSHTSPGGSGSIGGAHGVGHGQLGTSSTLSILEAQTIQAQDMEIKRLYADLGHAQRQRNEALDRWHELSHRMQENERSWMEDHRREEQGLQKRLHEVRSQLERREGECSRLQKTVNNYKDKIQQLEQVGSELKMDRDRLQEEVTEHKRNLSEKERALRQVQEDHDRYHGQEVERQGRLERRVEEVLEELRQTRTKSLSDLHQVERERNGLRAQVQEAKKQLQAVEKMLAQREREREVIDIQMAKLQEGLQKHKEQLLMLDGRVIETQRAKEEVERQQRMSILAMEHLKLENTRLQHLRRPI